MKRILCFLFGHIWREKHLKDSVGDVRMARICDRCGKTEYGAPF